ncbi:chemotaxis protein CheW [Patulibacter minatonensis]|uniref:chemotaxis protein CheW n=1 Tax=Patulibacter minatonensis TaxID=298163 RepID=UPI0004AF6298|nr:chemotaxis protein CheW [Patulibacter minatonensis]
MSTTTTTTPVGGDAAPAATSSQLVVLRLGREEYALPIDHVQEIIFWTPPRPVSSDLPWVSGVIALRGKILPVFDLALRLDVPRGEHAGARIVVVETGSEQIGVTVDDATEVLTVQAGDLEALPQGTGHDLLRAITKVGDRLIAVLDLSTLAASARPDARSAAGVAATGAAGTGATSGAAVGPGAASPDTGTVGTPSSAGSAPPAAGTVAGPTGAVAPAAPAATTAVR